jgi:hypothetical protein
MRRVKKRKKVSENNLKSVELMSHIHIEVERSKKKVVEKAKLVILFLQTEKYFEIAVIIFSFSTLKSQSAGRA